MLGMLLGRLRLAVQGFDAHALHQRCHMLTRDLDVVLIQQIAQHARACVRHIQMLSIDAFHQIQIAIRDRPSRAG